MSARAVNTIKDSFIPVNEAQESVTGVNHSRTSQDVSKADVSEDSGKNWQHLN